MNWWDSIETHSELTEYPQHGDAGGGDGGWGINFEELVAAVRLLPSHVDGLSLALTAADLATKIPPLRIVQPEYPYINAWTTGLGMLAFLIGRPTTPIDPGSTHFRRADGFREAALSILRQTPNLVPTGPAETDLADPSAMLRHAHLWLIELLATQYSLQARAVHEVARSQVLLGQDVLPGMSKAELPELSGLFQERYGFDVEPITSAAFASWLIATREEFINTATIATNAHEPNRMKAIMTSYLDVHSIRVEDIPKVARELKSYGRTEGFANHFFGLYPFINVAGRDDDPTQKVITAPHPYLIDRVSMGLVRHASDLARAKYGQPDNPFRNAIGKAAFEPYVGALLHSECKASTVHGEFVTNRNDLANGTAPDSPDWILFQGDSVVLLECKIVPLRQGTFFGSSLEDATADYSDPQRVPSVARLNCG
jgi:hypothetical protein